MLVAIVNNGVAVIFGTPQEVFPNVSFRRDSVPNAEFLAENNAVVVDTAWMPDIDETTQRFIQKDPYLNANGDFVVWDVINLTAEELQAKAAIPYLQADYSEFWQELVRSPIYTAIKDAAKVDLTANVLATELISIFSDAKNGKLDIEVMQAGIWEVVGALSLMDPVDPDTGLPTLGLVSSLSSMMSEHGLQVYSLTPPVV